MSWPAALLAAAVVAGYVCLGVINRPVSVYVWARDVSVCASVGMDKVREAVRVDAGDNPVQNP